MQFWKCLAAGVVGVAGLASSVSAQQTATYLYDVHGRLVTNATAAASGASHLTTYGYDSADNRTSRNSAAVPVRSSADRLLPGETLLPTQSVVSNDGQSRLTLGADGSMIMTCNGAFQVAFYGVNGEAAQLAMQGDGNLVLYNYATAPLWSTSTSGHPGALLVLQDDGNAVIYSGATPVWASWTSC